jgi:DNA primase
MIKKFYLGFDSFNLVNDDFFKVNQLSSSFFIKNGFFSKDGNNYYSKLYDRLIFPVFDVKGNVIAFSGRYMDNKIPKYWTNSNNDVFQKSLTFYGLYQSLPMITSTKAVLIVEGNIDVISCYQAKIKNVVAAFGTSFTYNHFLLLRAFANTFVFCFDNDKAGKKAEEKVLEFSKTIDDVTVKFLNLEDSHDPDEFLNKHFNNGKILKEVFEDLAGLL